MKRSAIGLLLLTVLVFSGCCFYKKTKCEGWENKIDSEEASRLVTYYSAMQLREKKLFLEDSKVYYDDSIKSIELEYTTMEIMTFCEARLMMVEFVDGFLDWLNDHPVLSSQLSHYPFTADDLYVHILFKNFYAEYVDPLYVGLAILEDGIVTYYASDIKDQWADWSHQRVEPYFKSRELAYIKQEADQIYPPPKTYPAPGKPNRQNDVLIAIPQGKLRPGVTGAAVTPYVPPVIPARKSTTPARKPLTTTPTTMSPAPRSSVFPNPTGTGFTNSPGGATSLPAGATSSPT